MTLDPESQSLHQHVARFLVALAHLVELHRMGEVSAVDAAHQSGYAVDAVQRAARSGASQLIVTFNADVPFVRFVPLHAAPWVFRKLQPLARALRDHDWSELRVAPTIRPEDVVALSGRIAAPAHDAEPLDLAAVALGSERFEDLASVLSVDPTAPVTSLSQAYAAVVAALWDAQSALARGEMPPLVRLTRVAQLTVDLADTRRLAMTTPTAERLDGDRAARWIDTSMLASEMCLFVTPDRHVRRAVALAGLLLYLAPFDERGAASQDGPPSVSRGRRLVDPERLASRTLGLIVGIPHAGRTARLAASLAYEAQRRRYRFLASSPDASSPVSMEAVVLATAIRFFELRAKQRGPDVIDGVLAMLQDEVVNERDEVGLRLLMAALGAIPRGAVVELDTGEVARVVSAAREAIPAEPEVEVVVDAQGTKVLAPHAMDLARPLDDSAPRRGIRAVLALRAGAGDIPKVGSRDRPAARKHAPSQPKATRSSAPQRRALRDKSTTPATGMRPPEAVHLGPEILEDIVTPSSKRGSRPPAGEQEMNGELVTGNPGPDADRSD